MGVRALPFNVKCPDCGQDAGSPCVSKIDLSPVKAHRNRRKKAVEAGHVENVKDGEGLPCAWCRSPVDNGSVWLPTEHSAHRVTARMHAKPCYRAWLAAWDELHKEKTG